MTLKEANNHSGGGCSNGELLRRVPSLARLEIADVPDEDLNLTGREKQWNEIFKDGRNVPGNLMLAEDYIRTIPEKSFILEIGSGSEGRVLGHVVKKRKAIMGLGIDINRAAVKNARLNCKYENVAFRVMDGDDLKLPDESVDEVLMTGVLGVVEPEVRKNIFLEVFRVLKPGGRLGSAEFKWMIGDPEKAKKYEDAEKVTHEPGTRLVKVGDKELILKHFIDDELIKLFVDAGFSPESIETRGESFASPGIGDGIVETRRQLTVWGTKPKQEERKLVAA